MKIKTKTNKRVNNAVAECRKAITESTIELLKQLGAEVGQDVVFRHTLILHNFKNETSETILADRIAYMDSQKDGSQFYVTQFNDEYWGSSCFLSIDNMLRIYDEVKCLVRSE